VGGCLGDVGQGREAFTEGEGAGLVVSGVGGECDWGIGSLGDFTCCSEF